VRAVSGSEAIFAMLDLIFRHHCEPVCFPTIHPDGRALPRARLGGIRVAEPRIVVGSEPS
jgi:hypothetical protein